jgi:hypothetical protein
MAPILLLAIATHREPGLARERCEQIKDSGGAWLAHLGPVLARDYPPRSRVRRSLRERDEGRARSEVRQPDVVEVPLGEFGLGNSARRSANRAEP